MHDALQKEIATYEKAARRNRRSAQRALERIPLGVASNYRHYEPYPIFVKDGRVAGFTTSTQRSTSTTTCVSAR